MGVCIKINTILFQGRCTLSLSHLDTQLLLMICRPPKMGEPIHTGASQNLFEPSVGVICEYHK